MDVATVLKALAHQHLSGIMCVLTENLRLLSAVAIAARPVPPDLSWSQGLCSLPHQSSGLRGAELDLKYLKKSGLSAYLP